MRSFLVGLLLVAAVGGPAYGQAAGFVEKIGFGKQYRPYGWTPMLVNLQSQIGEPAEYTIQVRQEDLDRDRVVFQRDIVLNANKQEQFWVYFLAQPRGLGEGSVAELRQTLDVRLCTRGGKPLVKLDVADQIINLEPGRGPGGLGGASRGAKLVLMVSDGSGSRSTPAIREFQGAIGMSEETNVVRVTPFDLPENVLGYDAVDAIVWLDANAGDMTSGGSRRLAAMTDFVRSGGRLVVCQPIELFKLEDMLDLLPVQAKGPGGEWLVEMRDKKDLEPIPTLAKYRIKETDYGQDAVDLLTRQRQGWDAIEKRGPFKVAYAKLRDDAVGEEWIDWTGDGAQRSPWLARRALGFGSVTWVAQDLGNPAITGGGATGWAYVWDKVLGQRNTDMRVGGETRGDRRYAKEAIERYHANNAADLGFAFLRGMEHEGRAGGLIFLAGVFFVGYWVIAGPVSYLVLLGKKRTDLSWTIFALSALGATLLTVGVVRLVLRGDAEVHHVSLVRMLPAGKTDDGKPVSRALVSSRIGLYIPRDGDQRVTLAGNDEKELSTLTPYSIHPAHYEVSADFPAYLTYAIPVRDNPMTEPVSAAFPYRRTLKKIEARWAGMIGGGIETAGSPDQDKPRLVPRDQGFLAGKLVNRTGGDLAHVYFAFNFPATEQGQTDEDLVLYRPTWASDEVIDLAAEYANASYVPPPGVTATNRNAVPGVANKKAIKATTIEHWFHYWFSALQSSGMSDRFDDSRNDYLRSFPMVSLFERITPRFNADPTKTVRVELLRRAARDWDVSDLVAAGQLVILAQRGQPGVLDRNPLPIPMDVEGERVTGTGTTFYQAALALDRTALPPPWTKPTEDGSGDEPPVEAAPTDAHNVEN